MLLGFVAPAMVWFVVGSALGQTSSAGDAVPTPDAPQPVGARPLQARPARTPEQQAARNGVPVYLINGVPYVRPTAHDLFADYAKDTYLLNGFVRSTVRALYTQARDQPSGWGRTLTVGGALAAVLERPASCWYSQRTAGFSATRDDGAIPLRSKGQILGAAVGR